MSLGASHQPHNLNLTTGKASCVTFPFKLKSYIINIASLIVVLFIFKGKIVCYTIGNLTIFTLKMEWTLSCTFETNVDCVSMILQQKKIQYKQKK